MSVGAGWPQSASPSLRVRVVDGAEIAAVGASSFPVVAGPDQPPEHFAAAGDGVIPTTVVPKDFAFECGVE